MDSEDLLERVRALRATGRTPKEIARAFGPRPAQVAPPVRTIAALGGKIANGYQPFRFEGLDNTVQVFIAGREQGGLFRSRQFVRRAVPAEALQKA